MAIERIEWQCPQCERRYAIPADLPRPSLCPKCQPDETQPTATAVATSAGVIDLAPPSLGDDVAFETPKGERDTGADRYRRKYPVLRIISLFYRCLAAVIILATVVAFVSGVVNVFRLRISPRVGPPLQLVWGRWSAAHSGVSRFWHLPS